MFHRSLSLGVCVAGLLAAATPAQAGNESWVSGTGTDAGTCPRNAPCRTFQFAHDQTSNNGSVNVLTPGNFGPLTITKPISIVAEGVEAVINTATNGAAITVEAGGGAVISLRGLTIDMRNNNNNGIVFTSGAALHVRDTAIRKANSAIIFGPLGASDFYIADSVISDSENDQVSVQAPGSGAVSAVLERVQIENGNGAGIVFGFGSGAITGTVRNSVSSGHLSAGIRAQGNGSPITVMVDRTVSVNNNTGVSATGAGATVRIGDSTVTANDVSGLNVSGGGVMETYGTNQVDGNGTDVNGTLTSINPK